MGTDKALLLWQGIPLVAHVAGALAGATGRVVVVTRDAGRLVGLGLDVVPDDLGPQTPLAGVRTALRLAGSRPAAVVACDLPFLDARFVRCLLVLAAGDVDAVVPIRDGRPEPLHAVWQPSALPAIEAALGSPEPSPRAALGRLTVRWVDEQEWRGWDVDARSLRNVNTPAEFEAALREGSQPG